MFYLLEVFVFDMLNDNSATIEIVDYPEVLSDVQDTFHNFPGDICGYFPSENYGSQFEKLLKYVNVKIGDINKVRFDPGDMAYVHFCCQFFRVVTFPRDFAQKLADSMCSLKTLCGRYFEGV